MAGAIKFLAGQGGTLVEIGTGSGLGFFGSTFGASVQLGSYPDTTYICSSGGTQSGVKANNCKYDGSASGCLWNGTENTHIQRIPNLSGTLNVRFTNDTAVKAQNAKLRIYDRSNIDKGPSGVTCQMAELVHPWSSGLDNPAVPLGSGSTGWLVPSGSGVVMDCWASPGSGGVCPSGANTTDTQHDWYFAMSPTPTEIGSKTLFGLYFICEYL